MTGKKTEDGEGKKRFALTNWLKNDFLPPLKAIFQRLEREMNKRIVPRTQWDNATPHRESELMKLMKEELENVGGMMTFQPPNCPLTNCYNSAVFPAVAKKGTALGGLLNRGKYLECKRLWQVIEKAWDEYPLDSIARAFIHHDQVAAAIEKGKGSDEFLKE